MRPTPKLLAFAATVRATPAVLRAYDDTQLLRMHLRCQAFAHPDARELEAALEREAHERAEDRFHAAAAAAELAAPQHLVW